VISKRRSFVCWKVLESSKSNESYINSPDCKKPANATFAATMKLMLLIDLSEVGGYCIPKGATRFLSTFIVIEDACLLRRYS
jgi:hypothetical protein